MWFRDPGAKYNDIIYFFEPADRRLAPAPDTHKLPLAVWSLDVSNPWLEVADTDTSPSHGRARETGLTRFFERAPFEIVARIKPNLVERRNKRIIVIDCDRSI